jgi:ferredoxin-NADP reductase
MTALQLLSYIGIAVAIQLAIVLAIALARRSAKPATAAPVQELAIPKSALAWQGLRDFRVSRREYEDPGATQCSFYLEPIDGLPLPPYKPGQFLTFELAVADPGGPARDVVRCYSLSDMPHPGYYRVTVKRVTAPPRTPELPPGVSSGHFHDSIAVGSVLRSRAPSGHFYLDRQSEVPVVLIAGGIGITPMLSMARWCLTMQPHRAVHLYYGVRNAQEHAFKSTLEQVFSSAMCACLIVAYSQPGSADRVGEDFQHHGHVDIELLKRTLPHGTHQFYICGPAAMMEALVPALAKWGVAASDIHFEAFGPASVRLPGDVNPAQPSSAATRHEVHFRHSGRTLVWDGSAANLLEFAESHGISVPSGCRGGGCGSCATGVRSGSVQYDNPPDFDVVAGSCLMCVGKPASALELEV